MMSNAASCWMTHLSLSLGRLINESSMSHHQEEDSEEEKLKYYFMTQNNELNYLQQGSTYQNRLVHDQAVRSFRTKNFEKSRTDSDQDRKISRNQDPENLQNLRPSRRSVDPRFTGSEIWIF